jgi:transaldolase
MKLFIDTANLQQISEANELGLIDGVTTNPTLLAKEGKDFKELLIEISQLVKGPVSAEVVSLESEGMVREGRTLAKINDNIIVKVPITLEGLKAVRGLKAEGIATNVTLVFSANQALLAAKAGAAFVSPFVGRLDDISYVGLEVVEQILAVFENYDLESEVLVASVRNPTHVLQAALTGADAATIPYPVLLQLVKHPLTDLGIERFLADWKKAGLAKI